MKCSILTNFNTTIVNGTCLECEKVNLIGIDKEYFSLSLFVQFGPDKESVRVAYFRPLT